MTSITDFSLLANDQEIASYFINENIDVVSFMKLYIQVDKLLRAQIPHDLSTNHILQLQSALSQQASHIQSLQQSMTSLRDNIHSCLKDITNTDIKLILTEHLNSLQAQTQSQSNPALLQDLLSNFGDKLVNLNTEKLNDFDRKSLHTLSNFQSNLLKDLSTTLDSHTIHHKITSINDTLTTLHNNFTGNSSQKGKMTENMLYQNIVKAFPDSDVTLTRDQPESCDIQIARDGRPLILIDSKHCESSNVRKSDLDKFYADCQMNNACGILCNSFGGIANRKHFEIDIVEKRVYVFLSNHQFDPSLFQVASQIIYNIYDIIKDNQNENIELPPELYQQLKLEYNHFLQTFHEHLDKIKSNVNSLSQLSLQHLDHFFRRTSLKADTKPFKCQMCGTGFTYARALSKHMKEKHNVTTTSTRGRPKKSASDTASTE